MNHGLLTAGPNVHGTFHRMYMLERACELELLARQMNVEPVEIDPDVVRKYSERMVKRRGMPEYGLGEWEGIVRTVERAGHDYKR
jgi:ribulose-5-phosphate 4-epimerase/fuculose-1-phosphate aldolase